MNNQLFINNIMRKYLDYSSRLHLNCIRLDGGTNHNHDLKLVEICSQLRKNKIDFICRPIIELIFAEKNEVKFKKQLIPDILAFTQPNPKVIEITNTEKKDHAENKSYPREFDVVVVGVDDDLEGIM